MADIEINSREPFEPTEWLDDDGVLKQVRQIRLGMNKELLRNGPPVDPDGFDLLHKNLQELSKDAQKSKQLKQDEKSSEAEARIAMQIANNMAKTMGIGLFENQGEPIDVTPNPAHLIGKHVPAEGAMKVGDDTRSYEEFTATVGKALDEARRAGNQDE